MSCKSHAKRDLDARRGHSRSRAGPPGTRRRPRGRSSRAACGRAWRRRGRGPGSRERVQEAALAHVGAAQEGHLGQAVPRELPGEAALPANVTVGSSKTFRLASRGAPAAGDS